MGQANHRRRLQVFRSHGLSAAFFSELPNPPHERSHQRTDFSKRRHRPDGRLGLEARRGGRLRPRPRALSRHHPQRLSALHRAVAGSGEFEIRRYHALLTTRPPLQESDQSAVHFRISNTLAWSSVQMTLCWSSGAAMSAASITRGLVSKPRLLDTSTQVDR